MPKGVEHKLRFLLTHQENCVESLMPKGVEHRLGSCFMLETGRVESLMPKGVEHYQQRSVKTH